MRLWMGGRGRFFGNPMPGLGPTTGHLRPERHGARDDDYQPDVPGAWRSYRRRVDGSSYSRTSMPPARSRKHRRSR